MWEDDDDEENEYDPEAERKKLQALPIYQKAEEILELTERIVNLFESEGMEEMHKSMMMEDAMILQVKIAGAQAMDDFILKMENAVIIKIHARSLLAATSSLAYTDSVDKRYLKLLRDEIDAFRLLFLQWVNSFQIDTTKDPDGWGLFVPETD